MVKHESIRLLLTRPKRYRIGYERKKKEKVLLIKLLTTSSYHNTKIKWIVTIVYCDWSKNTQIVGEPIRENTL